MRASWWAVAGLVGCGGVPPVQVGPGAWTLEGSDPWRAGWIELTEEGGLSASVQMSRGTRGCQVSGPVRVEPGGWRLEPVAGGPVLHAQLTAEGLAVRVGGGPWCGDATWDPTGNWRTGWREPAIPGLVELGRLEPQLDARVRAVAGGLYPDLVRGLHELVPVEPPDGVHTVRGRFAADGTAAFVRVRTPGALWVAVQAGGQRTVLTDQAGWPHVPADVEALLAEAEVPTRLERRPRETLGVEDRPFVVAPVGALDAGDVVEVLAVHDTELRVRTVLPRAWWTGAPVREAALPQDAVAAAPATPPAWEDVLPVVAGEAVLGTAGATSLPPGAWWLVQADGTARPARPMGVRDACGASRVALEGAADGVVLARVRPRPVPDRPMDDGAGPADRVPVVDGWATARCGPGGCQVLHQASVGQREEQPTAGPIVGVLDLDGDDVPDLVTRDAAPGCDGVVAVRGARGGGVARACACP